MVQCSISADFEPKPFYSLRLRESSTQLAAVGFTDKVYVQLQLHGPHLNGNDKFLNTHT